MAGWILLPPGIGDEIHEEGVVAPGDLPVEGVDGGPQPGLDDLGHARIAQVLHAEGVLHVPGLIVEVHEHLEALLGHGQAGVVELDKALHHLLLGGVDVPPPEVPASSGRQSSDR
jgi:hypothetical protein